MKPSDIIIGRKYRHKNHSTIYLGIGRVTTFHNWEIRKDTKTFVILDGPMAGHIVLRPGQMFNMFSKFWAGFSLID